MNEMSRSSKDTGSNWLREVRRIYLSESSGKLAEVERAILGLEANPTSTVYERRLRHLLHNLIGSGASYGFPAITETARNMSTCLRSIRDEQASISTDAITKLREHLEHLRGIFGEARP